VSERQNGFGVLDAVAGLLGGLALGCSAWLLVAWLSSGPGRVKEIVAPVQPSSGSRQIPAVEVLALAAGIGVGARVAVQLLNHFRGVASS
jgi:hypothetical protein